MNARYLKHGDVTHSELGNYQGAYLLPANYQNGYPHPPSLTISVSSFSHHAIIIIYIPLPKAIWLYFSVVPFHFFSGELSVFFCPKPLSLSNSPISQKSGFLVKPAV